MLKKRLLLILGCSVILSALSGESYVLADTSLGIHKIIVKTSENDSIYGDSISIVYNKPITLANSNENNDTRISSSNILPLAPAGYNDAQSNSSAHRAAKNYTIQILVEPGSSTQPYTGTWAALGGKVIFNEFDPEHKSVILVPPSKTSQFFKPGDRVTVSVVQTILDAVNNSIDTSKATKTNTAS